MSREGHKRYRIKQQLMTIADRVNVMFYERGEPVDTSSGIIEFRKNSTSGKPGYYFEGKHIPISQERALDLHVNLDYSKQRRSVA